LSDITSYQYSRKIAPWCFDDENTFGPVHNKFFYGCGIRASGGYYEEANSSLGFQVQAEIDSYLSIFTDAQGTDFPIVRPPLVDTSIDWTGSYYATSTECVGIPESACDTVLPIRTEPARMRGSFNWTQYFYGEQTTGNFTLQRSGLRFEDWNEYGREHTPFSELLVCAPGEYEAASDAVVMNTTFEDSDRIFRNPWRWLAQVYLMPPEIDAGSPVLSPAFQKSTLVWKLAEYNDNLMLSCNTTGKFILTTCTTLLIRKQCGMSQFRSRMGISPICQKSRATARSLEQL
jgi:hypothetical protein